MGKTKQARRTNPDERNFGRKCQVKGCYTTNKTPGLKLHRIPDVKFWKVKHDMWVSAIKEENGAEWEPKQWHRLCSIHFKSRTPANYIDCEDYVPNCRVKYTVNTAQRFENGIDFNPKFDNGFDNRYVSRRLWLKQGFVAMVQQLPL